MKSALAALVIVPLFAQPPASQTPSVPAPSSQAAIAPQSTDFDKALAEGRQLLSTHRDKEAAQAGLRAVQLKPDRWEGFLLIATAMAEAKSYAEALPFYYRAFVLSPPSRQNAIEGLIEQVVVAKLSQPPPSLDGDWQGALDVGTGKLRLVLHVIKSEKGELSSKLDSPDQGSVGIAVVQTTLKGRLVHLEIPAIGGKFDGTLNPNGRTISGTFTQRGSLLPIAWTRIP